MIISQIYIFCEEMGFTRLCLHLTLINKRETYKKKTLGYGNKKRNKNM